MLSTMKQKDLRGVRFGRLVAMEPTAIRQNGKVCWTCRCDCGVILTVRGIALTNTNTKSCGCLRRDVTSARQTHGHTTGGRTSPEFRAWLNARSRCFWPKNTFYPAYGGRGITMCDDWRYSFEAFLRDMGRKPSPRHTLDRINNEGHYAPGNCRWVTQREQGNNTRRNHWITVDGVHMTIAQAARKYGRKYGTIFRRLQHGASGAEAVR